MFRTVADFEADWVVESQSTSRLLQLLTDCSLSQRVTPDGRSLGRIAWHLVATIGEMVSRAGLSGVPTLAEDALVPSSAAEITDCYSRAADALLSAIRAQWTDAELLEEVPMYGEPWARGYTLAVLLRHQAHHRGQMTVLMRQAGLPVVGVCGPAKEEWAAWGMPPME